MRDISIVYSVGEMLSNTVDHFNECVKLSELSHDPEILREVEELFISLVPGEGVVGDPEPGSVVEVLDGSGVAKCDHGTFESSLDLGFEIVIFISGFQIRSRNAKL